MACYLGTGTHGYRNVLALHDLVVIIMGFHGRMDGMDGWIYGYMALGVGRSFVSFSFLKISFFFVPLFALHTLDLYSTV